MQQQGYGYGKRLFVWLFGSFAAHALMIANLHAAVPSSSVAREETVLWFDEPHVAHVAHVAEVAEVAEPKIDAAEPPREPEPAPPLPTRRAGKPSSTVTQAPAEPPAVASDAAGTVELRETPSAAPTAHSVVSEMARAPQPAQLSLWLAPIALQKLVIVRSPSALLAAVPGYRDLLRGSNIDPFSHLHALRVFLPGFAAEQLMIAGVHSAGEAEIVQAAERMAASRERVPSWRSSSQLRAAAWLDGSGFDRGLAVRGSAFLIGSRRSLPRLLGDDASVERHSKTRRGVVVLAALHDASRYLPDLATCGLRSLRVSVSDALRLQLTADYETTQAAAQAATCLSALGGPAKQLRWLRELLARATAADSGTQAQLKTRVTSEEIATLLDELTWSLRRLVRA